MGGISTIREVLDSALDAYIQKKHREELAELLGTDFFEGHFETMRKRSTKRLK